MADQIQPAPRAHPEIAVHPPQTDASHSNFSRPTTASNAAVPAPTATPAQGTEAPVATTPVAPTTTAPTQDHVNLNMRLNAADRYWKFKGALQAVAILVGLIGIGAMGWCVSTWPKSVYAYGYDGLLSVWPCLITFSVSIVWCLACILTLVLRKKGVHPGLRVTIELFLWLGFVVTALFAVAAVLDLSLWGADGELYGYSSRRMGLGCGTVRARARARRRMRAIAMARVGTAIMAATAPTAPLSSARVRSKTHTSTNYGRRSRIGIVWS
jgi:hypothetical protein